MKNMWRALAWEMTGTFFLCFVITAGAHNTSASTPALPLAIGWTLAVMVFAGGPVSGGHFNPAVTLGCMLRGATPPRTAALYMVCQLLGALIAGGFGRALRGSAAGYPKVSSSYNDTSGRAAAFWAEVVYSAALVFTVLSVATTKATRGNHFFGLAIGSVVFVGASTVGSISGAALNPAVGIGLCAANSTFEWIYAVAPFVGSVMAWAVFTFTHPDDVFREAKLTTGEDAMMGALRLATRTYVTEFLGALYLVLTVGLAVDSTNGKDPIQGLAIGAILMIMVYAGGHVSGGHYNPAVTLGVFLSGKMGVPLSLSGCVRPLGYVASQLVGGFTGAGLARGLVAPTSTNIGFPSVGAGFSEFEGMLAESILTFALVSVVLFTACSKHTDGNSYFGFCIGMTIFCGATSVGPISGGAFNPAVGTALPVIARSAGQVWIYWIGPLAGGCAAAAFHRVVYTDDLIPKSEDGITQNGKNMELRDIDNDYSARDDGAPWEGDVALLVMDEDSRDGGKGMHYE